MIKWLLKSFVILMAILLMVYGCVYGADYLTYEEWQPEFTLIDGTPITRPVDLSEKDYVYLMWTDPACEYCVAQLRAFDEYMAIAGIPTTDYDIILVYREVPTGLDPRVTSILGPTKSALPHTEFWVNHPEQGWFKLASWTGYYTVEEMDQLFLETAEENNASNSEA